MFSDRLHRLPNLDRLLRGHLTYELHSDSSFKQQVSHPDLIELSARTKLQGSRKPSHMQQLLNGWGVHLPAATARAVRTGWDQLRHPET